MWTLFLYTIIAIVAIISILYYIEILAIFRLIREFHPDLWHKLGKPNFSTQSPEAHRQLHKYLKRVVKREEPEVVAGAREKARKTLIYHKINSVTISLVAILLLANAFLAD